MSKHTLGPWRAVFSKWDAEVQIENGTPIAWVECVEPLPDEDRANFHLIAAAPDLLEALEDLYHYAGCLHDMPSQHRHRLRKARAALARAKGEPS